MQTETSRGPLAEDEHSRKAIAAELSSDSYSAVVILCLSPCISVCICAWTCGTLLDLLEYVPNLSRCKLGTLETWFQICTWTSWERLPTCSLTSWELANLHG